MAVAVQGAYYSAYWNNTKHAKKLSQVIEMIYKDPNEPKPEANVDEFEERQRRFEKYAEFTTNKNSRI